MKEKFTSFPKTPASGWKLFENVRKEPPFQVDPTLTLPCEGRGRVPNYFSSPVPLSLSNTLGMSSDGLRRAESAAFSRDAPIAVVARS